MQERDFGCSGTLNASWTLGTKKCRNSERKDHSCRPQSDLCMPLLHLSVGFIETDSLPQRRISVWLMFRWGGVFKGLRQYENTSASPTLGVKVRPSDLLLSCLPLLCSNWTLLNFCEFNTKAAWPSAYWRLHCHRNGHLHYAFPWVKCATNHDLSSQ